MRLRIGKQADADLDEIWLFIARESGSSEIATRALERITQTFGLLVQFPLVGRSRGSANYTDLRSYNCGNYVVYYRTSLGILQIVRVIHGNRVHFGPIPTE